MESRLEDSADRDGKSAVDRSLSSDCYAVMPTPSLSCPAKAGHPVTTEASVETVSRTTHAEGTGSPACAGDDRNEIDIGKWDFSSLSCPAKAGHPVTTGASVETASRTTPAEGTGSLACAGDDRNEIDEGKMEFTFRSNQSFPFQLP